MIRRQRGEEGDEEWLRRDADENHRGARVKAMAICTRHSFLHIYKPILLLALEEYFKHPTAETLAGLFTAVNNMDLSAMPKLSRYERTILAASDNKDMFAEKFDEAAALSPPGHTRSPSSTGSDGHPVSHFATRRQFPGINSAIPRDTHEFETKVVYNSIPVPIRVPVAILPETVGDFSLIQLITTFSAPHLHNPQPFALHPHLTTNGPYTHPIIVLINGLLTEKRIVFLSHDRPSGEVANHVLAACALASGGVLRGFTRHAFPYTDLSKIDELLQVQGFIAGVKNPAFAHHPTWWDILCNIDTGRIKISPELAQPPPYPEATATFSAILGSDPPQDPCDLVFMDEIHHLISSRFGEKSVRAKFRDWIIRFTQIAAAFEETVYGTSPLWIGHEENHVLKGHGYVWDSETSKTRDLAANLHRIEGWRRSRTYQSYASDVKTAYEEKPIKFIDFYHQIDRLRKVRSLSHDEAGRILKTLKEYVNEPDQLTMLLCYLPENQGGLFPIASGMFHPDRKVRFAVVELLERIKGHTAGKHFFAALNRFLKLAWERGKRELEEMGEQGLLADIKVDGLSNGVAQAVREGLRSPV